MRPVSLNEYIKRQQAPTRYAVTKLRQKNLPPPIEFVEQAYDITTDKWQRAYLDNALKTSAVAIVACRQTGKTTVTGGFAGWLMLEYSDLFVLTVSRSLRQASHLLSKVKEGIRKYAPEAILYSNQLGMGLANGSKILCVPCQGSDAARGFSAEFLLVDEAAFVPDDVFTALTPSLAATHGALHLISSPNGPVGTFHSAVEGTSMDDFYSIRVRADHIDRFDPAFLESQRRLLGDVRYRQEYLAEFLLMEGAFFRGETTKMVFGGEEIDEGSMTRADYADIVEAEVVDLERALDVRITSDWRSSLVE